MDARRYGWGMRRLEYERRRRGWNQTQLAYRARLTQGDISMLERGRLVLTPLRAERLARVLGVSPETLLDFVPAFEAQLLELTRVAG